MPSSASECLARALDAVCTVLDIARERPYGVEPPVFCQTRGIVDFLATLSDDEVARCEAEGLATRLGELDEAPASLRELGQAMLAVTKLPVRLHEDKPVQIGKQRSVSDRKHSEIESLLATVAPLVAQAQRIVDVGAGRGHFTRIAAEFFEVDTVGIERVPERVDTAARLSLGTRASFRLLDATREPLALSAGDLAVGLHACGGLGDRLIRSAADARCAVVLVSCCLQKIDTTERHPVSAQAMRAGFVLSKEILGLSNLTARRVGVESTLSETMDARRRRWMLARLLRHRGHPVALGEEMRGINRRVAHRPFAELVQRSLSARQLPAASALEIAEHERQGTLEFARMRRFALPRSMVARPLEVTVAFDRAAMLEERGYSARVAEVFDMDVTPRNLATIGTMR